MYILKNRGTGKTPIQFQLRNKDFEIVALFKKRNAQKIFDKHKIDLEDIPIDIFLDKLSFGKITKIITKNIL